MKAVLTNSHGDLDALAFVEDYAEPRPSVNEAIVKVAACAVNYHDIFTRRGMPGIKINLPVIAGSDIAGEVIDVGENVSPDLLGRRVLVDPVFRSGEKFGMIGETANGGRAEKVAVPSDQLIPVPDGVSLEDAACLPLAYGTAWRMMTVRGRIGKGEKALILGASGGVGVACVQIAKMAGAEVIACASADEKIARLKDLGADHVVNYTDIPFREYIKENFGKPSLDGGGGVDVAVNFTGGDTMLDTQKCVTLGGRILTCGATAGYNLSIDARYWWTFEHEMIGSNGWTPDDLKNLLQLIERGDLRPVIDKSLPLEDAAGAERLLEERRVFGKILLIP